MVRSLLLALCLVASAHAAVDPRAPSSDKAAATDYLKRLRSSFGSRGDFEASGCPKIPPQQWLKLLLPGQSVPVSFKFSKGCDVEGTVSVSRDPFPLDLKLRHVKGADRVHAILTPTISPELSEGLVRVTLHVDQGSLFQGKGPAVLDFASVYRTALGMDGKPREKRQADVRVTKYRGKPVSLAETVPFD